ncbi:MAG TPA: hypothetical protein VEJ18_03600 [Planctomycetota bacterium]|nr:hypothetical protein [Planctomycetota bacterium]
MTWPTNCFETLQAQLAEARRQLAEAQQALAAWRQIAERAEANGAEARAESARLRRQLVALREQITPSWRGAGTPEVPCQLCGQTEDIRHTWQDCAERLRAALSWVARRHHELGHAGPESFEACDAETCTRARESLAAPSTVQGAAKLATNSECEKYREPAALHGRCLDCGRAAIEHVRPVCGRCGAPFSCDRAEANSERRKNADAVVDSHPPTAECPISECHDCALRDCPHGEPLHYDKDGCPACERLPNLGVGIEPEAGTPEKSNYQHAASKPLASEPSRCPHFYVEGTCVECREGGSPPKVADDPFGPPEDPATCVHAWEPHLWERGELYCPRCMSTRPKGADTRTPVDTGPRDDAYHAALAALDEDDR